MTEAKILSLKDLFFRIKQFYYGVSDKTESAADKTAGETADYVAALKEAEAGFALPDGEEGRALPTDAEKMLRHLCALARTALVEKNVRLAGDLAALGIRLIGVYTFPSMGRRRFWEKCMLPFRDRHGEEYFAELEEEFLGGAPTALRLSPSFERREGRYYEDDADEALKLAHPVLYYVFSALGALLFLGFVIGFGLVTRLVIGVSSPWLVMGYLGAAALSIGVYSLAMTLVRQYMGHFLTVLLSAGGALLIALSLFLAL